jgi:hypothetical protein
MKRNDDTSWRASEKSKVRAHYRSAWLGWTDPVSGERLEVRVSGGEQLLPELVSLGFELLADRDPRDAERDPRDAHRLGATRAARGEAHRSWRSLAFAALLGERREDAGITDATAL